MFIFCRSATTQSPRESCGYCICHIDLWSWFAIYGNKTEINMANGTARKKTNHREWMDWLGWSVYRCWSTLARFDTERKIYKQINTIHAKEIREETKKISAAGVGLLQAFLPIQKEGRSGHSATRACMLRACARHANLRVAATDVTVPWPEDLVSRYVPLIIASSMSWRFFKSSSPSGCKNVEKKGQRVRVNTG